jgi:hypothetical protein
MQLQIGPGRKFIVIIGDDGAVFALIDKNSLMNKLFVQSAAAKDRREINALLLKNPSVPIHIFLDGMEQTYLKQSLPAVSAFSIGKLVKKRLERDFARTDIKGAVSRGRDSEGRKDWQYMLVSTPATTSIIEWLDYFATLRNKISGIALLPLEMENILKSLNKIILEQDAQKQKWQFIVTHNRTSGFRQTVLNEDKVVFTRLIRQGKDNLPDIIAGNIEQEIINTLDYLRRLGLTDEKFVDIIVIASAEIKTSLATTKIRGRPLILFTPFEISKSLGYGNIAERTDRFADIVLAVLFSKYRTILKLDNPRAKGVDRLLISYKATIGVMICVAPSSLIYCGLMTYELFDMQKKIKGVEEQKFNIEREWKQIRSTGEYGIDEANKVTDAIGIRKKLLEEQVSPIDVLEKIANIQADYISLESINWGFSKEYSASAKKPQVTSLVNVDFSTKDSNIDAVFRNYDTYAAALQNTFPDFQIEMTKMPDRITFDSQGASIPIQIKLTSKDKSATTHKLGRT